MLVEESFAEAIIKENKELKSALEALTTQNARLIEERDQVMARRAELSKKYEELRERVQNDALISAAIKKLV